MLLNRRDSLKAGGMLAVLATQGLVGWDAAEAASRRAGFDATTLEGALSALGARPVTSDQVTLSALDVVEDGAVAPVRIVSRLPGTTEIHLLVEKNPIPAVGQLHAAARNRCRHPVAGEDGREQPGVRGGSRRRQAVHDQQADRRHARQLRRVRPP